MLKELPRKGLIALLYIFNGIFRTQYWPRVLKTAEIIVIPKPGKDPKDPTSCRPISLLSTISKVLERLLAHKITTDEKYVNSIPDHQFGFRLDTWILWIPIWILEPIAKASHSEASVLCSVLGNPRKIL
jgi:hypothetical protein